MEYKNLPAKAGKLLNAVASIGYDTEVALCDLIDNSIDANATVIEVSLEHLIENGEETNIISPYVIADNGIGMDEDTLINALTLGSDRDYPSGSLGKFGLGLKSAGLSLGSRLTIISKKREMDEPICAILSIQDVEEQGEYRIKIGSLEDEYVVLWNKYAIEEHGTVLIIDDVYEAEQSLSRFGDYFARHCGITYHMLIEDKDLCIKINGTIINAEDPIHEKEAMKNGSLNPYSWDGKTVHMLLEEQELNLNHDISCKISATNLIHPPSFEDESNDRSIIDKREFYRIDTDPFTRRPRHGFYIYRNKRIIVMAERFHGLVSSATQAWAFRGRLMFDESADQVLSLDVKKRHMRLPRNARNTLKILIENYQTKSINAWKITGERHTQSKKNRDIIVNTGLSNTEVNNLDYNPSGDVDTPEEKQQKTLNQNKISSEAIKNIRDKNITKDDIIQKAANDHSIIYVDGIKGNPMWIPYAATKLKKAEVLLNTQHSWVEEAIRIIEENPKSAMLMYQFFAILSRAELEIRTTPWKDVSTKDAEIVLDKFRRAVSVIGENVAISIDEALRKIKQEMKDEE